MITASRGAVNTAMGAIMFGTSENTSKTVLEAKMDRYSGEPDDNVGRIYRHWHPQSEKYTGGDALLTAIKEMSE